MSTVSIDQARQAFLALSLTHLATRQHKLSLEMATVRRMRRQLAVKGFGAEAENGGDSSYGRTSWLADQTENLKGSCTPQ
jgi:hypothetical protein